MPSPRNSNIFQSHRTGLLFLCALLALYPTALLAISWKTHTLLRKKQSKSLLHGNSLARPFIIGRKASRVRRLCDLAVGYLLKGIQAVAAGVEGVHEMHCGELIWNSQKIQESAVPKLEVRLVW